MLTIIACGGGGEAEPTLAAQGTPTVPARLPIVTPTPGAAGTPQSSPETSPPAESPPASQGETYTVQEGDSLQSIALEFDVDITA
jgi:LysM repeat protein